MPAAAERRFQPGFDDQLDLVDTQQAGAQREHIGIVMLAAVGRGGIIHTHGSANTGHLVGSHAAANARAVNDDPAAGSALADLVRNRKGKIRVIHSFFAACAAINHGMPQFFEKGN